MIKRLLVLGLFFIASFSFGKDVLISFDGSGYLDMWKDTIQFAKDNHVVFTYFVSAPYYVTEEQEKAHPYWALTEDKRKLLIKFRDDRQTSNIHLRFNYMDEAQKAGCEIGSHLVGHYDGRPWTYEQWMKEFDYFKWAMDRDRWDFDAVDQQQIKCVRAPFMCTNPNYFKALKDSGFINDTSGINVREPRLIASGVIAVTEIPVKVIPICDADGDVLDTKVSMFDCDWVELVEWKKYPDLKMFYTTENTTPSLNQIVELDDIRNMYFETLCYDYLHGVGPTMICLHFQHRVGEPYYNAMKRFVQWVKDKNPNYLTYSEYADKINNSPITKKNTKF